jgi:hypothetical protein
VDDNQLIAAWVKWVTIGVVTFTVACIGSCQMTNYQIRRAIDSGAGPIAARCAFDSSGTTGCDLVRAAEAEATRAK